MQVNTKAELCFGRYLTLVHSCIFLLNRTNFQRPVIGVGNMNATKTLIIDVGDVGKGQNLKVTLSNPGYLTTTTTKIMMMIVVNVKKYIIT